MESEQPFALPDIAKHFGCLTPISIPRLAVGGESILHIPSDDWKAVLNKPFALKNLQEKIAYFLNLEPTTFWSLYVDYDYLLCNNEQLRSVLDYVIVYKYMKHGRFDFKIDNCVDEKGITYFFENYSKQFVGLGWQLLQKRLLAHKKAMQRVVSNVENKTLDLTFQGITGLDNTVHPQAAEVETLILNCNWMKFPCLRKIRYCFPNIKTISFVGCPLEIPETAERELFLHDLYAMHIKERMLQLTINVPWYGLLTVGVLPLYDPLTIRLSSGNNVEVLAAFQKAAACQWYNAQKVMVKIGKMAVCSTVISLLLSFWIMNIGFDKGRKTYFTYKVPSFVDLCIQLVGHKDFIQYIGIVIGSCTKIIHDAYKEDWFYNSVPQIIIE